MFSLEFNGSREAEKVADSQGYDFSLTSRTFTKTFCQKDLLLKQILIFQFGYEFMGKNAGNFSVALTYLWIPRCVA